MTHNNAQDFITSEFARRTDLIDDVNFRKICVRMAKALGITAQEWNENKAMLMLFFANEYCAIENKNK